MRPSTFLVVFLGVLQCANAFIAAAKPTSGLSPAMAPPQTSNVRLPTSKGLSPSSLSSSASSEDSVLIEKDFRVSAIFLIGGLLLDKIPYIKWTLGPLVTLLGVLFLVQTFRLKFVCDSDSFFLENTTKKSGENIILGGKNRWKYDCFVNYEFFPKGWIDQPQGPLLVYFKETQTPSEKRIQGPGGIANSEESLAKGVKPGQAHFFPALCNSKQLRAEWEKRGCSKL